MSFQVNSRKICLTYAQCPVSTADALAFIKGLCSTNALQYACVAREKHADGGLHLHAAIRVTTAIRTRSAQYFDLVDRSGDSRITYHPNVQSARRFSDWVKYVKKGGDYIEEGDEKEIKEDSDRLDPSELIEKAKSLDLVSFLAFCSVNQYQMAKDIWTLAHEDTSMSILDGDNIGGVINVKFENLAKKLVWNQNLTLLIIGESGIGKTTWAKQMMPKPILFVSHLDDLRKFRENFHKSILFDDVRINHMPETSQIHLLDTENPRSIHVRYGTVRIPARTPKVFTCNSYPVTYELPAIKRRSQLLLCFKDDLDRVF